MIHYAEILREKFRGKICTLITRQVSLPVNDAIQHSQYFTGIVEEIDEAGVWLKHPQMNTAGFFTHPLVGIIEEQFIPENDPLAAQIKEQVEKKKKAGQPVSEFIPIEELTQMIKKKPS